MKRAAFTLLEVMVAVTILAVGLSTLFTGQIGAIRAAQRARATTIATLLARCKMGEIEEQVAAEGLPGGDVDGSDECCEGAEHEGFTCEWSIKRVVLPDEVLGDDEEGAMPPGGPAAARDEKGRPKSPLEGSGPLSDPAGLGTSLAMGDTSVLAPILQSYALPIIKPTIEEQVRRATVTVRWNEGDKQHSFDVVQFLVSDNVQPIEGAEQLIDGDE